MSARSVTGTVLASDQGNWPRTAVPDRAGRGAQLGSPDRVQSRGVVAAQLALKVTARRTVDGLAQADDAHLPLEVRHPEQRCRIAQDLPHNTARDGIPIKKKQTNKQTDTQAHKQSRGEPAIWTI